MPREPMTEERLAETGTAIYNLLLAARVDPTLRRWAQTANDGFEFLRAELAAKKAECEEYRAALQEIAYNTSTSIPKGLQPGVFFASQLSHAIGTAARALHREATE